MAEKAPFLPAGGRSLLLALLLLPGANADAGLAWEQHDGYRSAPLNVPPNGGTGFQLLSNSAAGISFEHRLTRQQLTSNYNFMNGSGVALGDYDQDGLCDVFFCSLFGPVALYRNLGDWRFQDVTQSAGLAATNALARGAAFADVDGDGDLDLLVTYSGKGARLFVNNGNGTFTDAQASELAARTGSTSLALADVDGDGDLDLYIANYGEETLRTGIVVSTRRVGGREEVVGRYRNRFRILDGQIVEFGEPHAFYLNDGKGRFTPVPWTTGRFRNENGRPLQSELWDFGLSVQFRDINGDTHPDIYVCNDFHSPDRIWINDGQGHFHAIARPAIRTTPYFSMGVDFADIDRDGHDDFFVVDMLSRFHHLRMTQIDPPSPPVRLTEEAAPDRPQVRRNMLFLNRGDQTYAEIAYFSGVAGSDWSWCPVFLDVDLDGYEDILVSNGFSYDIQDMDMLAYIRSLGKQPTSTARTNLLLYPPLNTPNFLFRNRGDSTFEEVGASWGFQSTNISHGVALGDLDNDGDLDVVVSCLDAPPLLYRNETSAPRIAVQLKGLPPNTRGIGARIRLLGGPFTQSQEMIAGGRYLAGDMPIRTFAALPGSQPATLEVIWRSGKRSTVRNVQPNRIYEIDERTATPPAPEAPPSAPSRWFEEPDESLKHRHTEPEFNDFAAQPLLHRKLSQAGPAAAWHDLDADGRPELIFGAGKGGKLSAFQWTDGAGWKPVESIPSAPALPGDVTGIVPWRDAEGRNLLLLGVSNYEAGGRPGPSLLLLDWKRQVLTAIPGAPTNVIGPIAIADLEGDGDLDLFAGGQSAPGQYPEASRSWLFRNENGTLRSEELPWLSECGFVNGAWFSDLNSDGYPELILACEWGPIRIFHNQAGRLDEQTDSLGLSGSTGWWQRVITADFDADGRLDLAAANWGLNTPYQAAPNRPLLLDYADIDGNGTFELIEADYHEATGQPVPRCNLQTLSAAIPSLLARFSSHKAFAQATLADLFAGSRTPAKRREAAVLENMVFLNRGARLEPVPLPREAQFAPAFGLAAADFNGDGLEDLFLAQNFSASRAGLPRFDAGRGLLLQGNGDGRFTPIPGQESRIVLHGDQRAALVEDPDQDGRPDLLVTQNNSAARFYRNVRGKAGLRVRLKGPPGNPDAIGAGVRLVSGSNSEIGPVREVQAGSGFCASGILLFSRSEDAKQVRVRWPGGKITTTPIPAGANEVRVEW